MDRSLIPGRGVIFFFVLKVQKGSGVHPVFLPIGTGVSFTRVKAAEA